MLAALGFLVGEQFHPLWGGAIDVPSYIAFQETPLQTFWPAVVFVISIFEVFSVFTFQNPVGSQPWTISLDHEAGDFGWDPLGLKPADGAAFAQMATKEIQASTRAREARSFGAPRARAAPPRARARRRERARAAASARAVSYTHLTLPTTPYV